jgi:prepilin-type N-terminal cleavage/methylation domain-containing protein
MMRTRGFTLIELLIVVAIIAILALIAVPNFLEAQTRAKVVRVRTDFRNILVAMEAYRVDNNEYPPDDPSGNYAGGTSWYGDLIPLTLLTTPIAYMTYVPTNPFFDLRQSRAAGESMGVGNYAYWGTDRHPELGDHGSNLFYHVVSCGPNLLNELGGNDLRPQYVIGRQAPFINNLYDPTNGTVSRGDLHMSSRGLTF